MSIMRCDRHDRPWDSDELEQCPLCLDTGICPEGECRAAEARGLLCACTGGCAYAEPEDATDDDLSARLDERDRATYINQLNKGWAK